LLPPLAVRLFYLTLKIAQHEAVHALGVERQDVKIFRGPGASREKMAGLDSPIDDSEIQIWGYQQAVTWQRMRRLPIGKGYFFAGSVAPGKRDRHSRRNHPARGQGRYQDK